MLAKKRDDILYWGLAALILYMPLHYYLCELLISGTNLDNVARDAVILMLCALVFFRKECFSSLLSIFVLVSCGVLTCFGVVSAVLNRSFPVLNILRTYLVPMLMFFICRSIRITKERFERLNLFLMIELAIVAFYGFIQAFFLTDDFLMLIGYPHNGDYMDYTYYISFYWGYQRTVGTFVGPNICGAILAVGMCSLLFADRSCPFKWYYIWGSLFMTGLITTFSRSSWLGFAAATGFFVLLRKSWTRLTKKTLGRIGLVILAVAIFLVLDYLILDSLVLRMFLSQTLRTFTNEDPSANAHMEHLTSPPVITTPEVPDESVPSALAFLMNFGTNGPLAAEIMPNATKVESSYYLMQYELGLIGALVYYAPYVLLIVQTVINRKRCTCYVPAAVCIAIMVSYVFLPNVQTFEIPFYCFMFMGFYDNPSVKELYPAQTV